ncbi:MAG: cupin domain-containing protein [Sphingobacteriaceae bacterium]|nr:MAG: cupin domain-containing protein [Sphingobacteriaceae bacterium]
MAFKGKTLHNPVSGQTITFIQTGKDTNGKLLEMETVYRSRSVIPAEHYHPFQDEYFTVIEGEVRVKLDGKTSMLRTGDTLHIPANMRHAMWNPGSSKAVVNWQVRPALTTEYLFETTWGLAADGKVNKNGMPNMLQLALTVSKFSDVFRVIKPPVIIQKVLFGLITPVAYLLGYRPTYNRYLN